MGKATVDFSLDITTEAEPGSFPVPVVVVGSSPAPLPLLGGTVEIEIEIGPAPVARTVTVSELLVRLEPPVTNLQASLLFDTFTLAPGAKASNKIILERNGPLPSAIGSKVRITGTEA